MILLTVIGCFHAHVAQGAGNAAPEIAGVRVGLADRYKVGLWTPIEVTLRGGGEAMAGQVSVTVPDGDAVPSRVSTPADRPCRVPADGATSVRLYARIGRVQSSLTAEFRVDGQVVAQKVFQTGPQANGRCFLAALEQQSLVVTVGPAAMGVEQAAQLQRLPAGRRTVTARLDNLEPLPAKWYGYEGVDAILLSASHPDAYRSLQLDDERIEALDEWIRTGGRLVLCVGAQGEEVLGDRSPLRRFAPGRLEKMAVLRQTGALEAYCRSSTPVPPLVGGKRWSMRAPRLVDVEGVVEAREGDLPLVVVTPRGFGQVVFLAVDLDQSPLAEWSDRGLLVARLLDFPPPYFDESESNAAVMHFGYTDMAGQLRSALDRFEGVWLTPFWVVAGLVVLYILLIGPGDYFFLRKALGRMEWTWVTFPLIVLAFSLAACGLAWWLKGSRLRTHQLDLIDVDVASGRVRGTTWVNVFSPQSRSYDFSLEPRLPDGAEPRDARVLMSWLGLPGAGLGGMNPRAADPVLSSGQYDFAPELDAVEGVPIPIWSTKSLTARWSAAAGDSPSADLTDQDQFLVGTVANTLSFPLSHCVLAYEGWAYELGTIRPGESARLGPDARRSELKTLLTGWKMVREKAKDRSQMDQYRHEATPYDPGSTDLPYILREMMFFDASGGRRYAGLGNDYQRFVDLSGLLKTGRAILMAQGPAEAAGDRLHTELLCDGRPVPASQQRRVVAYRFVFPVRKSGH